MNIIEKVSDITVSDLVEYLRLDEVSQAEQNTLTTMRDTAINYIKNYTGQTNLDIYQDLVIVVFVLVQDMWDNRSMYVDKNNTNKVVESILNMHCINLLPKED